jgi:hypothetical protein
MTTLSLRICWASLLAIAPLCSSAKDPWTCEHAVASPDTPGLDQLSPRPLTPLRYQGKFTGAALLRRYLPKSGKFLELGAGNFDLEMLKLAIGSPRRDITITDLDEDLPQEYQDFLRDRVYEYLTDTVDRRGHLESYFDPRIKDYLSRIDLPLRAALSASPSRIMEWLIPLDLSHLLPQNFHTIGGFSNHKVFPFPDQHFDGIVMTKGLCDCQPNEQTLCGGIPTSMEGLTLFLSEVSRSLNHSNPQAAAVLQGCYYGRSLGTDPATKPYFSLGVFNQAIAAVEAKFPMLEFRYLEFDSLYAGLHISPR